MALSENQNREIFISYCHADNDNMISDGWIEQFHEVLRMLLKLMTGAREPEKELGIWRDKELQGNNEDSIKYLDSLFKFMSGYSWRTDTQRTFFFCEYS